MKFGLWIALLVWLGGCSAGHKSQWPVVQNFELSSYLGTWYEIARLDHRFERGLSDVTAQYQLHPSEAGRVVVINRGFDAKQNTWRQAEGKAYLTGAPNQGQLKVSFFGPFYGAYQILALDAKRYALVAGPNRDYLWILARQPGLDAELRQSLLQQAEALGFDSSQLIWVSHQLNSAGLPPPAIAPAR